MGTNKLIRKLEEFFDLSKAKQIKKQDKLNKFINKLEDKKSNLEKEMIEQSEIDETSEAYRELEREFKAISKLLKRARQGHHDLSLDETD